MNIAVSGLAPREEAAFGFFLERHFKGWAWRHAPAGPGMVLPQADLYLVDLLAAGLAHASAEAEARLLALLQGTPAVLLLPATDTSWPAAMPEARAREHGIVWLHKPYGTDAMREALQRAAASRQSRRAASGAPFAAAVASPPVTRGAEAGLTPQRVPGAGRGLAASAGRHSAVPDAAAAASQARPTLRPLVAVAADRVSGAASAEAPTMTVEQFAAQVARASDGAPGKAFFQRVAALLKSGQPFELGFTIQNLLVFHPQSDWVAGNTPMSVVKRVSRSDALSSVVSVRELDAAQAEARVQQLGLRLRELEEFLAEWIDGWAQDEAQAQRACA